MKHTKIQSIRSKNTLIASHGFRPLDFYLENGLHHLNCQDNVGMTAYDVLQSIYQGEPDYEGFYKHLSERESHGIPHSFGDLIRLAKHYNCEIPRVKGGKLIFSTI